MLALRSDANSRAQLGCNHSDSMALQACEIQVLRPGLQFTLGPGDCRCAIRRSSPAFGVEHTIVAVRNAHDDSSEVEKRQHHGNECGLLAAMRGRGRGEDPGRLSFKLSFQPDRTSRVEKL